MTDGFLPFELPGGDAFHLKLASVVMKAVQARIPGASAAEELLMPCAGKLGDDAHLIKAQVTANHLCSLQRLQGAHLVCQRCCDPAINDSISKLNGEAR